MIVYFSIPGELMNLQAPKLEMKTLILLRLPFSLFLLPVSLFSLWFSPGHQTWMTLLVFVIWHLFVYPASNGYNSFHDRDTGPIGGLSNPPLPDKSLLYTVNVLDFLSLLLAFWVHFLFAGFVLVYIVFSRLYSHRSVRLKRFPLLGYLVVIFFQGAWVFAANLLVFNGFSLVWQQTHLLGMVISSLLIATIYPITQIYQHEADGKDGVKTLSMMLGVRGTFLYCIGLFVVVHVLMMILAAEMNRQGLFYGFAVSMAPAAVYFLFWLFRCWHHPQRANHKSTMQMLIISSLMINFYFLTSIFFLP